VRTFLQALGPLAGAVERRLDELDRDRFLERTWDKDPTPWASDAAQREAVRDRLGWLDAPATFRSRAGELQAFARSVHADGLRHAVLLGMGGSSLAAEVFRKAFGVRADGLDVRVLDSTDPAAVRATVSSLPLGKCLVIVASKSGTTIETEALTELSDLARRSGYRRCFENPADVGGRFSALTWFGLVPAALLGVDVARLLDGAVAAAEESGRQTRPSDSPAVRLGAALGEAAAAGRDKLTLALPPRLAALGAWIEQLVAESTGKKGRGLLPVDGETLGSPGAYGRDRIFVHARLGTTQDDAVAARVEALTAAEHPVVTVDVPSVDDVGGEMLRWEIATAVASAVLGVNAFDEPDVKLAKTLTARHLEAIERPGAAQRPVPLIDEQGVQLFADAGLSLRPGSSRLSDWIEAHLRRVGTADYLALLAYVRRTDRLHYGLESLRTRLRDCLQAAVTLGYGPRYLHSTGQLHKGGPNRGVFVLLTHEGGRDVDVPGRPWSFGQLELAQASGDFQALSDRKRRVMRLHLGRRLVPGLATVRAALEEALRRLEREPIRR
jgi:glucose-6-phosphate isomerase